MLQVTGAAGLDDAVNCCLPLSATMAEPGSTETRMSTMRTLILRNCLVSTWEVAVTVTVEGFVGGDAGGFRGSPATSGEYGQRQQSGTAQLFHTPSFETAMTRSQPSHRAKARSSVSADGWTRWAGAQPPSEVSPQCRRASKGVSNWLGAEST